MERIRRINEQARFSELCNQLRRNSAAVDMVGPGRFGLPEPFLDAHALELSDALQQNSQAFDVSFEISHLTEAAGSRLGQALAREGSQISRVGLGVHVRDEDDAGASALDAVLRILKTSSKLENLLFALLAKQLDLCAGSLRDLLLETRTLRTISFHGCLLESKTAQEAITDGIAKSSVKKVSLNSAHSSTVEAVLKGLELNQQCETLRISLGLSYGKSSRLIRAFLESDKCAISNLHLDCSSSFVNLKDVFLGVKGNTSISALELGNGFLLPSDAAFLGHLLQSDNCCIKELAFVDLAFPESDAFGTIMASLHQNQSVEKLHLEDSSFGGEFFNRKMLELLVENRVLKTLCLRDNPGLTYFTDNRYADTYVDFECGSSQVERIILEKMGLRNEQLSNLFRCLRSECFSFIRHLSLLDNAISEDGCQQVVDFVQQRRVRELDLSDNAIGDGGAVAFAGLLRQEQSPLEELYLDNIGVKERGMLCLFSALGEHQSSSLHTLTLKGNQIGDICLDALSKLLSGITFLRELHVTLSSDVSREAKERFLAALRQNTSVHDLDIDGTVDDQMQEKVSFFGTRNAEILPLTDVTNSTSLASLWPRVFAHYGGSSSRDASYRNLILRKKLLWMLENRQESLSRKRRAEEAPSESNEVDGR